MRHLPLYRGQGPPSPTEYIAEVYERFDLAMAALRRGMGRRLRAAGLSIPCKAGCSACCYLPVIATEHDLVLLLAALRQMAAEERDEIERAVRNWHSEARARGLPTSGALEPEAYDAHQRARLRCPLLDAGGQCRVYDDRPLICRGYLVAARDPRECESLDVGVQRIHVADRRDDVHALLGAPAIEMLLPVLLREAWELVRGEPTEKQLRALRDRLRKKATSRSRSDPDRGLRRGGRVHS